MINLLKGFTPWFNIVFRFDNGETIITHCSKNLVDETMEWLRYKRWERYHTFRLKESRIFVIDRNHVVCCHVRLDDEKRMED